MSGGFIFNDHWVETGNNMTEYLIDLCLKYFYETEGHEQHPDVLEFLEFMKGFMFMGMYVHFENEKSKIKTSSNKFLSQVLTKVCDFAENDEEDLSELGRSIMKEYFRPMVLAIEKSATD
jgi:hypothetical protein